MKGNTIVMKMKDLNKKEDLLMERGWEMTGDGSTKKEMRRVNFLLARVRKTYRNIWKHNIPLQTRIENDSFFAYCDKMRGQCQ